MEDPKKLEEGFGKDHTLENAADDHINARDENESKAGEQPLVKQKTKRVATLDAFRGLTIVVIYTYLGKSTLLALSLNFLIISKVW